MIISLEVGMTSYIFEDGKVIGDKEEFSKYRLLSNSMIQPRNLYLYKYLVFKKADSY